MKPITISLVFSYNDDEGFATQEEFNQHCLNLAIEDIGNAYMEDQLEYILKIKEILSDVV